MICPKCNLENEESAKFCCECGANLFVIKTCPKCNSQGNGDSTFCKNCGTKLVDKIIKPPKPHKTKKVGKSKRLVIIIACIVIVLAATIVGYFLLKHNQTYLRTEKVDETNYRELNEMLSWVNDYPGLAKMTDEEKLIYFAAYVTIYGRSKKSPWNENEIDVWGECGSKKAVEAILSHFFGVEKIYHERSKLYRSWEDWYVDYPIDGVGGGYARNWVNVTRLQDLGDGTFLADVNSYYIHYENWDESFFDPVSQWKLKENSIIIDGSYWDFESGNAIRYDSCTLTLKPFVFRGKRTWQIVGVNGVAVPKVLFENAKEIARKYSDEEFEKLRTENGLISDYVNSDIVKNNIEVMSTANGFLYFMKTFKGSGKQVITGSKVLVHYTGKFLDGTVFDSSLTNGQPIEIIVGQGYVIPGLEETLLLMRGGDKITVLIPSKLAYGSRGAGDVIPPYTPLVFDMEVVSVE